MIFSQKGTIYPKTRLYNSGICHLLSVLILLILLFESCTDKKEGVCSNEQSICNSIYYWKTHFVITDYDRSFLRTHEIHRMYVKFFDVDDDAPNPYSEANRIVPVASTVFESPKPDSVEIIPTVYLTLRAISFIEKSSGGSKEAAQKIVTRVLNMADYNDMGPINEVQLDCDWTETTQDAYFSLCKEVGVLLKEKDIALSSTIRLHQLRTPAPPVDRGVLMLYNTGNLQSVSEKNSIISLDNVANYLKGKRIDYALPLDFAYPTYSWGLVYWGNHFEGIIHQFDFSNTDLYEPDGNGYYKVKQYHKVEGESIYEGSRIRMESSPVDVILEVKDLVNKAFPGISYSNIIYHLDSNNLSKYTTDEIKSIYRN